MSDDTRAFDALLPPEMAAKAEAVGAAKTQQPRLRTFALAVLGGAFIALGAAFSTTVVAGANGALPLGVTRLLAGASFSSDRASQQFAFHAGLCLGSSGRCSP